MTKKERIIVVCGKFDTLNRDELQFLRKAKDKGDWLVVGVYSDLWMTNNNNGFMQNHDTRIDIVQSIKYVDEVFRFNDYDGSACQLLKIVKIVYPNSHITFITEEDIASMPESHIRGINFEVIKLGED